MNTQTTETTALEPQAMTNQQAIEAARAMGIDLLDAQLLLLFALGRASHERAWLLAHDTNEMLQDEQNQYMALLQRRAVGVPVAYLVGEKEFYGITFSVDKRVLVPRPETELLVDWAKELLLLNPRAVPTPISTTETSKNNPLKLLDLGTGSGILAVTLKYLHPEVDVTAVDASNEALAVATLNASEILPPPSVVRFACGSWFAPLAGERFDYIVSNPPYVVDTDGHLADLQHEPLEALAAGADGLDDIREIIHQAPSHLMPNGWLLIEHGYDQREAVQALFANAGFTQIETRQDLAGIDRATGGQWHR